jgi:hypothetical protein
MKISNPMFAPFAKPNLKQEQSLKYTSKEYMGLLNLFNARLVNSNLNCLQFKIVILQQCMKTSNPLNAAYVKINLEAMHILNDTSRVFIMKCSGLLNVTVVQLNMEQMDTFTDT